MYYLHDDLGFYYGEFATLQDAIEEMDKYKNCQEGMFISTTKNPWK